MIKRWCRIVISGLILVSSVLVYNIFAQEHSAKAIMDKVFTRYDGDDSYSEVEMVLLDKKGYERKRQLEIYTKDYGKLIKTYIKFTEPADIRGTAFLSIENEGKDNTQYLYLPALGRARRIVSSQKKLRFVNTDYNLVITSNNATQCNLTTIVYPNGSATFFNIILKIIKMLFFLKRAVPSGTK